MAANEYTYKDFIDDLNRLLESDRLKNIENVRTADFLVGMKGWLSDTSGGYGVIASYDPENTDNHTHISWRVLYEMILASTIYE